MSLRRLKATVNEDDMANNWGAAYVEDVTYGGSKIELDQEIRRTIPPFRLMFMLESGTSANDRAITTATEGSYSSCLFGMGAYAGGVGILNDYSSSVMMNNKQLSLVKEPSTCSDLAQEQTVPLPYHIPHQSLNDKELQDLENKCLKALTMKLLLSALSGRPYKAFLLEYILSGTGGELTVRFLLNFAAVLSRFHVCIIADEVMTGGRVGPMVAITSTMPNTFVESVKYITLGKSFGCGLVLEKIFDSREDGRGTTTYIEPDEACSKYKAVAMRIDEGMIALKREKVIRSMKLQAESNNIWGCGLLIFTSKCRFATTGNLKNRLLPALENGTKTKLKLGTTNTTWDRETVNAHLFQRIRDWLDHRKVHSLSPYTWKLAKYLYDNPLAETVYAEELVAYIDLSGDSVTMVHTHREKKKRELGPRDGRCSASHNNLVRATLRTAQQSSDGFLTAAVKTKKRRLCYSIHYNRKEAS